MHVEVSPKVITGSCLCKYTVPWRWTSESVTSFIRVLRARESCFTRYLHSPIALPWNSSDFDVLSPHSHTSVARMTSTWRVVRKAGTAPVISRRTFHRGSKIADLRRNDTRKGGHIPTIVKFWDFKPYLSVTLTPVSVTVRLQCQFNGRKQDHIILKSIWEWQLLRAALFSVSHYCHCNQQFL